MKFLKSSGGFRFLPGWLAVLALLPAMFVAPAEAQIITVNAWTNPSSGLWHDPASWSVGLPPFETNSIVAISNFNTKTITANASTPATNLLVRNLFVTAFQNRINTLLLTNLVAPLDVTRGFTMSNNAALQVYNSTLRLDGSTLGQFTLASAQGTLHSGAVLLTNTAVMKIGNGSGAASFTVSNGVLDAGSDLGIGAVDGSVGRLTNVNGQVRVGFQLTLADHPQSTGTVMMLNGSFTATNAAANVRIGQRGFGQFVISNGVAVFTDVSVGRQSGGNGELRVAGGDLSCRTLNIGRFTGSTGAVLVTGGTLAATEGNFYVGREGLGMFTNAGGIVSASRLIVADDTNTASGLAVLSGGQSFFVSGLLVGSLVSTGQAVLAGGTLFCTNSTTSSTSVVARGTFTLNSGNAACDVLEVPTSAGQVQFNGGTLSTIDLVVSNGTPFYVGDGVNPAVLELRGGTARFQNGLVIRANAQLTGCGTVVGGITVDPGGVNALTTCPAGPPTAHLTYPFDGDTFFTPVSIPLAAVARDPGGSVTKVEFYQGATKLGEDTTSPFTFNWASVPAGGYALTARSTDNSSNIKTSSVINIVVTTPPPPPVMTNLNVVRADDNKSLKSFYAGSPDGNEPVLDLNTLAEENKVLVEPGSSAFFWEFRFVDPPTNAPNPVAASVTLQFRPESDWAGTFSAQFFNDSALLATVNLPASGAGGGTLTSYVWDLTSVATTREIIDGARLRVVNTSDNGKKVTVSFAQLSYGVAAAAGNQPPVLTLPPNTNINELVAWSAQAAASDSDTPAQTLTFAKVSGPGALTVSATGLIAWTPGEADGPTTNAVSVRVFDNGTPSLSVTQSFQIIVHEVNLAPALTLPPNTNINELVAWSAQAAASDSDVPAQTLTFALVSGPGALTVSGAGLIAWTPSEADGPTTNAVSVRVFDNGTPSLSVTQSFQIIVHEVNLAPVLTLPPNTNINELVAYAATAASADADVPAQALTFALVSGPSGLTVSAGGAIQWTPTQFQGPTTNVVSVRVFDNGVPSLSVTQSYQVVVSDLIVPPIVLTNAALVPGGLRFSFTSSNTIAYTVEYKTNLSAGVWQPLTNVTAAGPLTHVTNAPQPTMRFFRVRSQ